MNPGEIRERRAAGKTRFLVTGATGFLGAHVTRSLLERGFEVTALVRNGRGTSAEDRFRRTMDWCGGGWDPEKAKVVAGDLAEERLGLPDEVWRALSEGVDEIVHCAASTSFSETRRADLERVNIGGTRSVLALASPGKVCAFHLLSTAYACGLGAGVSDPPARRPTGFTNAYEETKYGAEAEALRQAEVGGFSLSIYRPTIVYGDSVSGRSLRFNALYYPVKTVLFLRDLYLQDMRRGGTRSGAVGVESLPDGRLRLPLRIETDPEANLNMVPVDHFARTFMALLDTHPKGGLFPIATDEVLRVETVVDFTARLFGLDGLETCPAEAFRDRPRTALERLFLEYTLSYGPYMMDRRTFWDCTDGAASIPCPRFTFEVFGRLMRYAESVDWGKRTPWQSPPE